MLSLVPITIKFVRYFLYTFFYFIYNFFICSYILFKYCIYSLFLNSIIFIFYLIFLLFYKKFYYSLILLIFINISNTLYISQEQSCNVNLSNPCAINDKINVNFHVNSIYYNIYNFYKMTSDRDHNIFSLWIDHSLEEISPVSNSDNDYLFLTLPLLLFIFKLLFKKGKLGFINFLMFLLFLLSLALFDNKTSYLKNCTKKHFFTYETIKELDQVSSEFLKSNLNLYAASKLKLKNYFTFLTFLLLLSGDINPNPGPQGTNTDKMWEPFDKKGLHFIHININSLLQKIDQLKSIAQNQMQQ